MRDDGLDAARYAIPMMKMLGMLGNMVEEYTDEQVEIEDQHFATVKDEDGTHMYEKDPNSPDDIEVFNIK